jgi:hypothetical protein
VTSTRSRVAALAGAAATTVALVGAAGPASANPGVLALNPTNCSVATAVRVNVPYYPNTYCYSGNGSRRVNLTQVHSVESRNWTITVLWRPPGGSWTQTGMASGQTLYIQGGVVDTISSP